MPEIKPSHTRIEMNHSKLTKELRRSIIMTKMIINQRGIVLMMPNVLAHSLIMMQLRMTMTMVMRILSESEEIKLDLIREELARKAIFDFIITNNILFF